MFVAQEGTRSQQLLPHRTPLPIGYPGVAMKQIEILAVEQNHLNGSLSDIPFSSLKSLKCLNLAGLWAQ